jgi:hypothetical protein
MSFTYRLISLGDGDALLDLIAASPDAGLISFSYEYLAEPISVHTTLEPGLQGAVALHSDQVVGMVFGEATRVQWAGKVYTNEYFLP